MAATATKGARVTGAEREKAGEKFAKAYGRGKSIREIAEQSGRSYGFVQKVLAEHPDVTLRGRGGATRPKAKAKK